MTATAAVSMSWFYSCTSRRHLLSIPVLKITSPRFPLSSAVYHFTDQLSVAYVQNRRNLLKITAAMMQGEVETETEVAQAEAMARLQNPKLYFGNLPYNCDNEQLAGIIQEHASPEMIEVIYDKETGRSRGFAVVTMSSIQDCEAVISNLNGFVEYISFSYMCLSVSYVDESSILTIINNHTDAIIIIQSFIIHWKKSLQLSSNYSYAINLILKYYIFFNLVQRSRLILNGLSKIKLHVIKFVQLKVLNRDQFYIPFFINLYMGYHLRLILYSLKIKASFVIAFLLLYKSVIEKIIS